MPRSHQGLGLSSEEIKCVHVCGWSNPDCVCLPHYSCNSCLKLIIKWVKHQQEHRSNIGLIDNPSVRLTTRSLFIISFNRTSTTLKSPSQALLCVRACINTSCLARQTRLELATPRQTLSEPAFLQRWQKAACREHGFIERFNTSMRLPGANTCHSHQLPFCLCSGG